MTAAAKYDLTGAALVALMRASFAAQGIALGESAPSLKTASAHASLSAKERLAEAVLASRGPIALLKVGQSVGRMTHDPIGAALLAARSGPDLLSRWARLERYVHVRHPIIMRDIQTTSAVLDHRGYPFDPPSAAMDLVLAGVIGGLLTAIGCKDLSLTIGEGPTAFETMSQNQITAHVAPIPSPTGLWHFKWAAAPLEPKSDLALALQGKVAKEVVHLFETDLLKLWSLDELAHVMALSKRTLQRRLLEVGTSVQKLRRVAQIQKATNLLLDGKASLAAIGYACGFSDIAHFTRAFREASGASPGEYRKSVGGIAD